MNLFIDTNVYLSFYHFSSENLKALESLLVLIKKDSCNLFITNHIKDEFNRNREKKISDALKNFKCRLPDLTFPRFCMDYPEYDDMKEIQKHFSEKHETILEKIFQDIQSKSLKADKVIANLFSAANEIQVNEEIYHNAKVRLNLGNPPGKDNSLGDALNWECLLQSSTNHMDMNFISIDEDFVSPLDANKFNEFLFNEWAIHKKSKIIFFKSLSDFFKAYFPDITIPDELEKELLIRKMDISGSFIYTHQLIAELSKYNDYSVNQINSLLYSAYTNDQIAWIITDSDIYEFYIRLISGKEDGLNQEYLRNFYSLVGSDQSQETEEIPF